MKITIEAARGKDYPESILADAKFIEAMRQSVYRRLELRATDTVEIVIK